MASTEGKVLRDYIGRYMAGTKTIVQNKVPVGLNVSWQIERPVARLRSKKHLIMCDHSNYVETSSELTQ